MKIQIRKVFLVLALLAGIHPAQAQPTLTIAPAGKQSVLFWTATPANYFVQSVTNVLSNNWVTADDAVPVTAVTVSNTSPARFFRLMSVTTLSGMDFIPAGSFTMGNSIGDSDITDANSTNIYVSGFYMDSNLVRYSYWQAVYSNAIVNGYSFANAGLGKGPNYPVDTVDWYDCVKWCNDRSQVSGLTPVYYTDAGLTQVYKTGEVTPYVNWKANGFRLPTEAEWEKAARGGLTGRRFPWGNLISENQANYEGNTGSFTYDLGPNGYNAVGLAGGTPYTSPDGSFDMNGYGLYDMAGNLFEWCWDWYGTYGQPTPNNPTGPATGANRILRGGTWINAANYTRCALRGYSPPISANYSFGFRCVRGP